MINPSWAPSILNLALKRWCYNKMRVFLSKRIYGLHSLTSISAFLARVLAEASEQFKVSSLGRLLPILLQQYSFSTGLPLLWNCRSYGRSFICRSYLLHLGLIHILLILDSRCSFNKQRITAKIK